MRSYTPQMSLRQSQVQVGEAEIVPAHSWQALLCISLELKPQHRGLCSGTALQLGSCSQVVIRGFLAAPSPICVLSPVSVPDSHLEHSSAHSTPLAISSGYKIPSHFLS